MHDHLDGLRKYFQYAALGCTIASAWLTFLFGMQQSPAWYVAVACAGFFVFCSVASDYIWLFVSDAFKARRWVTFGAFVAGGLLVFSLNLMSNLGSVGWQRDVTISDARVKNAKADRAEANVGGSESRLKFLEGELQKLSDQAPWAASVSADALRAQLASANLAIEQEAKRGGCGPKCLARTKERDDLASRIAIAEKREDLSGQIKKLDEVVKGERERADKAADNRQVAAPLSQANFFAGMFSVSLTPTEHAEAWTDRGIASWIALGLCIAPILFSLIGWRPTTASHFPPRAAGGSEPAPTQIAPRVATTRRKWRDIYAAQCNTMGIAPVAT
jgi:hypothetical protein